MAFTKVSAAGINTGGSVQQGGNTGNPRAVLKFIS